MDRMDMQDLYRLTVLALVMLDSNNKIYSVLSYCTYGTLRELEMVTKSYKIYSFG